MAGPFCRRRQFRRVEFHIACPNVMLSLLHVSTSLGLRFPPRDSLSTPSSNSPAHVSRSDGGALRQDERPWRHSRVVSVGMPRRIRPVVSHVAGQTWMWAVMAFESRNRAGAAGLRLVPQQDFDAVRGVGHAPGAALLGSRREGTSGAAGAAVDRGGRIALPGLRRGRHGRTTRSIRGCGCPAPGNVASRVPSAVAFAREGPAHWGAPGDPSPRQCPRGVGDGDRRRVPREDTRRVHPVLAQHGGGPDPVSAGPLMGARMMVDEPGLDAPVPEECQGEHRCRQRTAGSGPVDDGEEPDSGRERQQGVGRQQEPRRGVGDEEEIRRHRRPQGCGGPARPALRPQSQADQQRQQPPPLRRGQPYAVVGAGAAQQRAVQRGEVGAQGEDGPQAPWTSSASASRLCTPPNRTSASTTQGSAPATSPAATAERRPQRRPWPRSAGISTAARSRGTATATPSLGRIRVTTARPAATPAYRGRGARKQPTAAAAPIAVWWFGIAELA